VLHDWPEKQAQKILEMIRGAMGPDSLLLLYELVVPDSGHSVWHAQMDITLMASLAALERTRAQWATLLDAAGFTLKTVWEPKNGAPGSGSLLEAVPK
jgi:demethylsterigmatocystin 6-O-methyltransferase